MRSLLRSINAALLCVTALGAAPYTIAPEPGSRFALEVHKTGLMSGKIHVFEYDRYSAPPAFAPPRPEAAKIALTIQASSIVCKDTWVDEKDKKKISQTALDMMQHANYPELKFTSTTVKRTAAGFDVLGDLTIKGITKPITVAVQMKEDGAALHFTGKAVIQRKDYKINPPSPVPFGIIGNKEEMPVSFTLMARK
jgi:polyisoprenoid-binding protein YceI